MTGPRHPLPGGVTVSAPGPRATGVGVNHGVISTGDVHTSAPVTLPPPDGVPPPASLHNLPPPTARALLGRRREASALERALRGGGPAPGAAAQVVTGLGGVGKSTLALHHAHTHRARHTAAWWISAESPEAITAALAALATRLIPTRDTTALPAPLLANWALAWLEAHPGWLLVLDNATHPRHLDPHLARLSGGTVLITTRRTHGWHHLAPRPLHLDVLTPAAATALLRRESGRTEAVHRPAAEELAEELGRLPLALEQAAAYLRLTHRTPADYLALFRDRPGHLLATRGDGDAYGATIARTWRITLDTLAGLGDRGPHAAHLLRVLAWYAPDGIPRTLLRRTGPDPVAVDEALALLAGYSMITLDADTAAVHRLVQTLARTPDPAGADPHRTCDAIDRARAAAVAALRDAVPRDPAADPAVRPAWRALLPHIDALTARTRPEQDTAALHPVLNEAALFLADEGRLPEAAAYAERSLALAVRLGGPGTPEALTARNNLAVIHAAAGDARRAAALFAEVLADRERTLGADHPDTLTARANLAEARAAAGEPGEAARLHEAVLADRLRILGADHPDTLTSRNNVARCHDAAGDAGRAVALFEEALAGHLRTLGPDSPATLNCRHNLAAALESAGDLDRALSLQREVLADRERLLGRDHPDTLTSRHNLAHVSLSTGDTAQAVRLFEACAADRRRLLGAEHPDTLTSRGGLASAHAAAGDLDRALSLQREVLADRERLLGRDHPDTLTSRNNLAHAHQAAGAPERAVPLHEKILAVRLRVLGPDHPHTLTTRNNLAAAHESAGAPERAVPLYRSLLADQTRARGADHPDTLLYRSNLACALFRTGDLDEALPLLESVLADRLRVLGRDHPDTLLSHSNLGSARLAAGERDRAVALYETALGGCERVLGTGHPTTALVRGKLASALGAPEPPVRQ